MAGERSQRLFGRVRRILEQKGISIQDIQNAEIYDELAEAQKQIFARVGFERKYNITLDNSEDEYELVVSSVNDRVCVKGIKIFITPSTWTYTLEYVPNTEWNETILSDSTASNPTHATLFDNTLHLYPTPATDGEILTLWAILCLPETDISATIDPEIGEEWNKALEYYALSSLLFDERERNDYFLKFREQIGEIKLTKTKKGYPIQKARTS